jgi:hypothetical protein
VSEISFNCPTLHEAQIDLVPFSQQQLAVHSKWFMVKIQVSIFYLKHVSMW